MTWGELLVLLMIVLLVWYGYIFLKYYSKDLVQRKKDGAAPIKWSREKTPSSKQEVKMDQHGQVHELLEELKIIFAAAVKDALTIAQIKEAIGLRLQKYVSLPAEIKISINQHIASEFSLQLKMNVTTEDINSLWK